LNLIEVVGNLHMHTPYSDGEAYHAEIAAAAARAGLDFIVVTDHNVLVRGVEGYYADDHAPILVLTGEEVHDQARLPQVNHCLVYDAHREVAQCAADPQTLIDAVNVAGGMTFLAHPNDHAIAWVHESAIPWVDWNVRNYTGIELWNYMSAFKDHLQTPLASLTHVYSPNSAVIGPGADTLHLWDRLLVAAHAEGQRVPAVGNSDAHGTVFTVGPLRKTVFSYEHCFRCVNTHIFIAEALRGDPVHDRVLIYEAVREGRMFIGYDVPGQTRGFRFQAEGAEGQTIMGERAALGNGQTLIVQAPRRARLRLFRNGRVIAEAAQSDRLTHRATTPGVYRVEAWKRYRGVERCWVLSNPIYLYQ